MIRCPQCKKAAPREDNPAFPFCSERCRLVDLGRWVGEEYRVPVEQPPPPEDAGNGSPEGSG